MGMAAMTASPRRRRGAAGLVAALALLSLLAGCVVYAPGGYGPYGPPRYHYWR
jgi:hypothetical protein